MTTTPFPSDDGDHADAAAEAADLVYQIIEWAAAGVAGNYAWHLVSRLRDAWPSSRWELHEEVDPLAFAEILVEVHAAEPDEDRGALDLVEFSEEILHERVARRTWRPAKEWRCEMVDEEFAYSVTMRKLDEERIPRVLRIHRRIRD